MVVQAVHHVVWVELALEQSVEVRAEFPLEGQLFAQSHGLTDMTEYGKCIQQVQKCICALKDTLVYRFTELLD